MSEKILFPRNPSSIDGTGEGEAFELSLMLFMEKKTLFVKKYFYDYWNSDEITDPYDKDDDGIDGSY